MNTCQNIESHNIMVTKKTKHTRAQTDLYDIQDQADQSMVVQVRMVLPLVGEY